jgi:hypothetical protein
VFSFICSCKRNAFLQETKLAGIFEKRPKAKGTKPKAGELTLGLLFGKQLPAFLTPMHYPVFLQHVASISTDWPGKLV